MARVPDAAAPRLAGALLLVLSAARPTLAGEPSLADLEAYKAHVEAEVAAAVAAAEPREPQHLTPCVGGMAGSYPCSNIDLLEFLPLATFQANDANSMWGWTDPLDGKEYVLLGLDNGTAFVDISDPENAVYLGKLPTHTGSSIWRDIRVYQNHAYIVADNNGYHGMQVFDLTQLRSVVSPPVVFSETAWYDKVRNVHTISIDESTGYAYLVGATSTGPGILTCNGGLHIVSLANPVSPQFVACYDDGGYVHENQCFVYHGPDATYTGHEVCLAARGSAESIDVIDVTNHAAPVRISTFRYQPVGVSSYSHQAWFSEDHRYILLNDELDETNVGNPTRTWIFDAADLDQLVKPGLGYWDHPTAAIDHNLYVRGEFVFESNYKAGLRILRLADLAQSTLEPVGFFDVFPGADDPNFDGTWNNYPFFASGVVPVTHISQGLFLLRPTSLCENPAAPAGLAATANGDNQIDLSWTGSGAPGATFDVERAAGGCAATFATIAEGLAGPTFSDLTASGGVTYGYRVRERDATGFCASGPSACVSETTTGACSEPPAFAGLASAASAGAGFCSIRLDWAAAIPFCGGPLGYSVYRSTDPLFVPAPGNRIAQGIAASAYDDLTAAPATTYHYVVRAADAAAGSEDGNLARRFARAAGPVGDATFATGAEVGDPMFDTGDALAGGPPPESPEHVGWHTTTARAHAGVRSFWSTQANNLCVTLEGDFILTAGQSPQLTYWTAWDTEADYDGGVLEVSTNGGGTWTRLVPVGGYPGQITQGGTLCGITQGSGAYEGPGALTFQSGSVNLAAYAGQTVRLRFLYRTDGGVTGEGWFVDDVAVTHAQVPSACTADAGVFVDDYETGDLLRWSLTAP